jgi:hypothetical protein
MRQRWEFLGDTDGREWQWRLVDSESGSIMRTSDVRFRSLLGCIKDAERQGYSGFRDLRQSCHRISVCAA